MNVSLLKIISLRLLDRRLVKGEGQPASPPGSVSVYFPFLVGPCVPNRWRPLVK